MTQVRSSGTDDASPLDVSARKDLAPAFLAMLPLLIVLLGIIAYPMLRSLWISLTDLKVGATANFIGFDNYVRLFSSKSIDYLQALRNTATYVIISVALKLILGIITALLLNAKLPGQRLFRALLFIPWTMPLVVGALIWRMMYNDNRGIISEKLLDWRIVDEYLYWISDPQLALMAVIVVVVWQGLPFYTTNILAALQSLNDEVTEAATIDGAGAITRFRYIVIPHLRNTITITVLLSLVWTAFSIEWLYVITNGGPLGSSETVPLLAFHLTLGSRDLGLAAAAAVTVMPIFLIVMIISVPKMVAND